MRPYRFLVPGILSIACLCSFTVAPLAAEDKLTIDRIYGGKEFASRSVSARWLPQGGYTTLETAARHPERHDIVHHDPSTGKKSVLVGAGDLIPPGESKPLKIEAYEFSTDQSKLLIYTNSKRVWRRNTRGDYWVLDRTARQLRRLGADFKPSTLMFAKLSPDGTQVAYVHEGNLYLENLFDKDTRALTTRDSEFIINGTTDWVYEEEFGLRDAFHWSPDGKRIAYWQLDTKGVRQFPLINNTDSLYPTVVWFAYPKVGQRNPSCRVAVVQCESGNTTWLKIPGDTRNHYIPRIQWAANSTQVLVQRLNRLQNTNTLFLAEAASGEARSLLRETDAAWVDVHDELFWLAKGQQFTWLSDRANWRHVFLASRSGEIRQLTKGSFDVIKLLQVDEAKQLAYVIASPKSAAERYLYQVDLADGKLKRVTPPNTNGTHAYKLSPYSRWAIHTFSSADEPPVTELITLPDHKTVRVLENNAKLKDKLKKLQLAKTEFFSVDIGQNQALEAWCIKPARMDPSKKYPLLVYVYGEPAGQTVVNRWNGSTYLWHQMLAQQGYVVMSFDNRGTKSPRGRQWRKCVYRQIGIMAPRDQAAAVQSVLRARPYLNKKRVGIWGWSGGGSSSLQAIFKYPDLYHTAIAIAPVPNQRYYDTIYQERYMGLPKDNVEGFRLGSPINFAKNLKGNLLLIHGTGDDNCHYQTMELLIDELIGHDKQFEMMAYPNRTHSIRERKNTTRHLRKLMTRYLQKNLPVSSDVVMPAANRKGGG